MSERPSERIRVLPDSVKKKIAAGEVVEGPFSVVKELVENSIDAGAGRIDVQVYDSGLKKIVVRDDGRGINREDVRLALMEHATSKIGDIHDIERVGSYGFRGEALSSISSVSRFTILTRREGEETGIRLVASEDGVELSDYAGAAGTTIIVENIFYNVPARKKFLRSPRAELRSIREALLRIALPNHDIEFTLDVDDGRVFTLMGAEDTGERIAQIYGTGILDDLCHDVLNDIKVTVSGFFSKPHYMKSSRSMQFLFVNRRPVEYKYLGFLLSKAYEAMAPGGKHPAGIVFVDIDPGLVDVNIHPAKKEVKLFDHRYIDSLIIGLARKALNREQRVRSGLFSTEPPSAAGLMEGGPGYTGSDEVTRGIFPDESRRSYYGGADTIGDHRHKGYSTAQERQDGAIRILGIVFGTYMLVEKNGALCFIDFHAAHERILYDGLMKKRGQFESQSLAFPRILELSIEDHALIMENIEKISEIGFDIEDFSDNSIRINAVPGVSRDEDAGVLLDDFLESARNGFGVLDSVAQMAATVACHAAKRAGESLTRDDMERLATEIFDGGRELRCPHGRPFVYTLAREDIEKMFKRQ